MHDGQSDEEGPRRAKLVNAEPRKVRFAVATSTARPIRKQVEHGAALRGDRRTLEREERERVEAREEGRRSNPKEDPRKANRSSRHPT